MLNNENKCSIITISLNEFKNNFYEYKSSKLDLFRYNSKSIMEDVKALAYIAHFYRIIRSNLQPDCCTVASSSKSYDKGDPFHSKALSFVEIFQYPF